MTLLEIVTVLGIVSSVSVAVSLNFSEVRSSFDKLTARGVLIQDLTRAQAEAVTAGCRMIFTVATDGRSYNYGCDLLPYDTGFPPSADVFSCVRPLPRRITLSPGTVIVFNSRGQSVDASGEMTNVTLRLSAETSRGVVNYVSGTLLGTGAFQYNG